MDFRLGSWGAHWTRHTHSPRLALNSSCPISSSRYRVTLTEKPPSAVLWLCLPYCSGWASRVADSRLLAAGPSSPTSVPEPSRHSRYRPVWTPRRMPEASTCRLKRPRRRSQARLPPPRSPKRDRQESALMKRPRTSEPPFHRSACLRKSWLSGLRPGTNATRIG